jgi:hypothetical protein
VSRRCARYAARNTVQMAHATVVVLAVTVSAAACGGGDDRQRTAADTSQELLLQPVGDTGPNPFTASTAAKPPADALPSPANSPTPKERPPAKLSSYRSVKGSTDGLYGGTRGVDSCDIEQQIRLLTKDQDRERAFAKVAGVGTSLLPDYLRSLTSVVLRKDTRVTSHSFADGRATDVPSVLQAGTAVLIDKEGMPRVRCACGNPLTSPTALERTASHKGSAWRGYDPEQTVVVTPASRPLTKIRIVDVVKKTWIERPTDNKSSKNNKDKVIPSPPTKLRGKATGTSTVELTWKAAKGDVKVAGYQIFQKGKEKPIQEVLPDSNGARVSNLKPATDYTFTVRAVDAAGNTSAASNKVDVFTDSEQSEQPVQPEQQPDQPQAPQPQPPDQQQPPQPQPPQPQPQPDQQQPPQPDQQQPPQPQPPPPDQQQPPQPDQQQPPDPQQPQPNQPPPQ